MGQKASGQVQGLSYFPDADDAPPAERRNLTRSGINAERGKPDLLLNSLKVEESRPQGKPTGGRVKDRGESQGPIVMIGIAVAANHPGQDHGASNRADFREVFQYESL